MGYQMAGFLQQIEDILGNKNKVIGAMFFCFTNRLIQTLIRAFQIVKAG